jgi:carbonic anhydrase/acetyltransferase-like protein (isoleucine patch superfamily)
MNAELRARFPAAAYIDPTVRIYGSVEIAEGASLWPYAVIRAEGFAVRIGRLSNLQDHVMVHVGDRAPIVVGEHCSIAHRAVLRLHPGRQLPDRHRRNRHARRGDRRELDRCGA